jgi:AcrR family transcriptional regulator
MGQSEKLRRPGYAPANNRLGRRGCHTRDRIVNSAAKLFVAKGFHGTSIEAIAKAVGGSRATVYQYFESKEAIFAELAGKCEPAVLEHGQRLGRLGPDIEGMRNLHRWLRDWARLYDRHAMVFLEFPGVGTIEGLPQTDAGAVSGQYAQLVTERLRAARVTGIDPDDATAALLRISHMVNLYRFRGMFGLRSEKTTSESLSIAMQLLLFPETPAHVIETVAAPGTVPPSEGTLRSSVMHTPPDEPELTGPSPIREDILAAGSLLFLERGYYSVAMEEIASAANVSRATLYRHFGNKAKILDELTGRAVVEGKHLAAELYQLANASSGFDQLHAWLARYVRFHRSYGGVIRAWYDGTLGERLAEMVSQGVAPFQLAATALLRHAELPPGMDLRVGVAIFIAVLGRMAERSMSHHRTETDYDTAGLMLLILQRSLLGERGHCR